MNSIKCWLVGICAIGCMFGCTKQEPNGDSDTSLAGIEIDLDKSNSELLLKYYWGGFLGPEGGDPFEAGLLTKDGNRFYLSMTDFEERYASFAPLLREAASDNVVDWDEFTSFIQQTYRQARNVPASLDILKSELNYGQDSPDWFAVEVNGVMSTARRHLFVPSESIRRALQDYADNGDQVIYPVGTVIIGEHYLEEAHVETTVMRKRQDGFWDFSTFGIDGTPVLATDTPPKPLKSPTQCVGCHFGSKLFEPERSFPGKAAEGPHGPREMNVPEAWRDVEITSFFKEHSKRSDTILGMYATLFVASLKEQARNGNLPEPDRQLLDKLGF